MMLELFCFFVFLMLLPLSGSVSVSVSKVPGSLLHDFASEFDSDFDPLRAVGSPSRKPIPIPIPMISVSTDAKVARGNFFAWVAGTDRLSMFLLVVEHFQRPGHFGL